MAQSRGYDKRSSASTSHQIRNRERERLRRKAVEVGNQVPSFQEPRRITVERQDSLSDKIQTVLGDMGKIHNVIGKDPNVWLGTSRVPTVNKTYNSDSGATNRRNEETHINSSSSNRYNIEQRSNMVNLPSRHPTATNTYSPYLLQHKSTSFHSSSFTMNGNDVHTNSERATSHPNYFPSSVSHPHNINSSGIGMRPHPRISDHKEHTSAGTNPSIPSPSHSQMPEGRQRLQSCDMESIFQEMRMKNEEPLSEIQTPRPGIGQEFNFSKYEHKPADSIATETCKESNVPQDVDSSDSSDNSDSDDESYTSNDSDSESDHEPPSNEVDWSLKEFMGDYEKPIDEPVIGSVGNDFVHENTDALHNTTQDSNTLETRVRRHDRSLHNNRQRGLCEATQQSTRISAASPSFKDNKTEVEEMMGEVRSRRHPESIPSVDIPPVRHRMPTERPRSKEQTKQQRSNRISTNKVQRRDSSSSSLKGCNPDPSSSRSLLPRNSAQPRSNKDLKHRKNSSPPRTVYSSKATVKTKEKKSCQSHHSQDTSNSLTHPGDVNGSSSSSYLDSRRKSHKNDSSSTLSSDRSGRVKTNKLNNSTSSSKTFSSYSNHPSGGSKHEVDLSSSESEADCSPCNSSSSNPTSSWTQGTNKKADLIASKHKTSNVSSKRKIADARSSCTAAISSAVNHEHRTNSPARKKPKKQLKINEKDIGSRSSNSTTGHQQPLKTMAEKSKEKSSNLSTRSSVPSKSGRVPKTSQRSSISDSNKPKGFPPLWVKVLTNPVVNIPSVIELCNTKAPTQHLSWCVVDGKGKKLSNNLLPSKSASKYDNVQPTTRLSASASGQTEIPDNMIPSRRANEVQVAVAASTSELYPGSQSSFNKRKHINPSSTLSASFNQTSIHNPKEKSRKKKNPPPQCQNFHGNSIQSHIAKRNKNESQWNEMEMEQANNMSSSQQSSEGAQQDISSNPLHSQPPDGATSQQPTKSSNNATDRRNSHTVAVTAGPADSSWPGNETRSKTSDQYMREGKRLKHKGDACTDPRTGRTRPGESLNRALAYFRAALCFMMNGYTLEVENLNGRKETSAHSPSNMYTQTIQLLDYIRKMRPHGIQEEVTFKRLNIACMRSQALLYKRVYHLQKDAAFKCSDAIMEYSKPNKCNRTPSPWHAVGGQSGVSPLSPAVPSPYGGNMPGPSPIAGISSTCEQVTSSTQIGKMASPSYHNGVLLSPKLLEMYKQFQSISLNIMHAHEKWDKAEPLLSDHQDFFRHVDVLSCHTLELSSSLHDLATYNEVILRQLWGAYKSPQE